MKRKRQEKQLEMPSQALLEAEVQRMRYRKRYSNVLRSTIYMLVVVAAFAVLVATIWLPVLQIYGSSMEPTLNEGNIVVSVKGSHFQQGDLVAFYIGNKILVKRVIAGPGQVVDIDEAGNVSVDGTFLDEPYLTENRWVGPISTCRIRCRTVGISVWEITAPLRWIPAILRSDVFPRNRSSVKSCSAYGPLPTSER